MPSRILNFSADRLITGINIIDNMLFFTDNENEPRKINITKFKGELIDPQSNEVIKVTHPTNGGATEIYGREFKERDISVLKEHPIDTLGTSLTEVGDVDISDINNFSPEYAPQDSKNIKVVYTGDLNPVLKNTRLKARVDFGKNIIENGFYFTQTDPGDGEEGKAALIVPANKVELNNMSTLDITGSEKTFEHLIDSSSLSEGFIWVVAYAKEKGFDTEYSKMKQILVGNPSTANNPITKLNVKLEAEFVATRFLPYLRAEASYETQSPDQVGQDQVGFYISRGYSNPNESITCEELIKEAQEDFGQELPIAVTADSLSADKQIFTYTSERHNINVEIGDTYYVVAYIMSNDGSITYSTALASVVTDQVTITTTFLPTVTHNEFSSLGAGALLSASTAKWSLGNISNMQKFGFLVSTNLSTAQELRDAFSEGFDADGKPIKAGNPETFRFISKEIPNDFAFSQNDFEYKTTEADLNGNIISIPGNADGVIPVGTNLHALAFVQMTTGQTAFAATAKTIKITNINDSALIITKMKLKELSTPFFKNDMKFDVELDVAYTPPGSVIEQIGVVSDLPRGNEITADSIRYSFRSKNGAAGLNNSNPEQHVSDPRLASSVWDFTATSSATDHPNVGKYSTKSNNPLVIPKLSKEDAQKYIDIGSELRQDEDYTDQILETRHLQGLCAYAFMVVKLQDGTTKRFETPIRQGEWDDLTGASYTSTGQFENNSGAPQVNTYSTEPTSANRRECVIGLTDVSFTALGSLAANGSKPDVSLEPVAELGFYVSTIPKPALAFGTIDTTGAAMLNWIADPATVKIPLAGSIAAYQTHGKSKDNTWKDFQITINSSNLSGIAANTTYYIAAYCIPDQEALTTSSAFPTLLNIENTYKNIRNKTKFGEIKQVKTLTTALGTATTVDESPTVIAVPVKTIQDHSQVSIFGNAKPGSANYSMQNPGFYIKPSQYINAGWNTAQIINDLATVSTNRVTVNATAFNKDNGSFLGVLSNISEPHHFIAFAQTVTPNGTTNTVHSTNFGEFENNSVSPPASDQFIEFDTPSATSDGVLNAGCKNSEASVASGNFGFYIVGREGSSFNAPADNTALKAIIDNPSAGDIVQTITLNQAFTNPFRATFSPKTNHKYYFVAFATTTGSNFSMSPVAAITYKAAANQKIQLSNYMVEFEQDGYTYGGNQTSTDITVTTTPAGAPWKFEILSWGGPSYIEPVAFKLGTNKLRIQTQGVDTQTRSMRIRVSLVENSNVAADIFVVVKGQSQFGYNDFNSIQDYGKSPFASYY